jgi:hypothetical protein
MSKINELNDISLLKIFSSLSYLSLKQLFQVFANWSHLLNEEFSKRKAQNQYFCYFNKKQTHEGDVVNSLKSQMDKIRTQPELIIGFSTKPLSIEFLNLFDSRQFNIITSGVVYGSPEERKYLQVPSIGNYFGCPEEILKKQFGYSGSSLAKYPNSLRIENIYNISNLKTLELNQDEYLACLMIFIDKRSPKIDELWEFFNNFNDNYAISASFVDEIQDKNGKSDFLALGFIGKSNKLQIKQMITSNLFKNEPRIYKDQEENIISSMSRANLKIDGSNITFAFQMNSVQASTNPSYYNYNKNIELDVFKNFYPQVPIIGLNVDGYIANEFNGHYEIDEQFVFKRLYNSTLFTIFSICDD